MEWISVKDRLPEDSRNKIVCYTYLDDQIISMDFFYSLINKEWRKNDPCFEDISAKEQITHWMPLPEPPKE